MFVEDEESNTGMSQVQVIWDTDSWGILNYLPLSWMNSLITTVVILGYPLYYWTSERLPPITEAVLSLIPALLASILVFFDPPTSVLCLERTLATTACVLSVVICPCCISNIYRKEDPTNVNWMLLPALSLIIILAFDTYFTWRTVVMCQALLLLATTLVFNYDQLVNRTPIRVKGEAKVSDHPESASTIIHPCYDTKDTSIEQYNNSHNVMICLGIVVAQILAVLSSVLFYTVFLVDIREQNNKNCATLWICFTQTGMSIASSFLLRKSHNICWLVMICLLMACIYQVVGMVTPLPVPLLANQWTELFLFMYMLCYGLGWSAMAREYMLGICSSVTQANACVSIAGALWISLFLIGS